MNSVKQSIPRLSQVRSPQKNQNEYNKEAITTDQKHQGCLDRLRIMALELDRMSDALRQKHQETLLLRQELDQSQVFPQSIPQYQVQNNNDDYLKRQLEDTQAKFDQFRKVKEQQILELENENSRVHKELKEIKLEKLEYVNRYSQQCEEVVRVQKELERSKNMKTDYSQLTNSIQILTEENQLLKAKLLANKDLSINSGKNGVYENNGITRIETTSKPSVQSYRSYQVETRVNGGVPEVKTQITKTVDGKTENYEFQGRDYQNNQQPIRDSQFNNNNFQRESQYNQYRESLYNNDQGQGRNSVIGQRQQTYTSQNKQNEGPLGTRTVQEFKQQVISSSTNNKY